MAQIKESSQGDPPYRMVLENDPDFKAVREFDSHVLISEELRNGDMIAAHYGDDDEPNKPNGVAEMTDQNSILETYPLSADFVMFTKRGIKGEQYPFKFMDVGQSFVVPVSDKHKEPWNTFGSTVTAANRRYKSENKLFRMRRVTAGTTYDNGSVETATGARIFRIQ